MDIGEGVGTHSMYQQLFGLDEAFWLVGGGKVHDLENDLGQLGDDSLDLAVDTEVFGNAFESSSLFDNEWMTTKIYLDEQFYTNHVTDDIPGAAEVVEIELSDDTTSQSSTDLVTDSYDLMLVDCPTSPEQNVPGMETNLDRSSQITDFVDAVCSGKITMEFPDLPCSNLNSLDESNSPSSENSPSSQKSEIYQSSQDSQSPKPPPSEDLSHSQDFHQLSVKDHGKTTDLALNGKNMALPKTSLKARKKTPEQKLRKQLQNRNAATRYRYKKRGEQETLNSQCDKLEGENQKMKLKIESLQQETQYLKKLFIDIYEKNTLTKNN